MSRSNLLEKNRWHSPSRERGYMTKKVFPVFLWLKRYSSVDGCFFFYRTLPPLQGKCETYRGNACAEFIGNQSIWVQYRIRHQQNIEKDLSSALAVIRALDHMSERYLQIVTVKWIKLVICTMKTNLRSGVLFWRKNACRRLSENKILDSLGSSAVVKFIICEANESEGLKEQGCVLFGSTVSTPTGSMGWYSWCFSIKHFSNCFRLSRGIGNSPHASYNLRLPLLPFQPGLRMGGKIHRPNHPKTVFHL